MINLTLTVKGAELNVHIQPTTACSGFNPHINVPKGEQITEHFFNLRGEKLYTLEFRYDLTGESFEVWDVTTADEVLLLHLYVNPSPIIGAVFGSPKIV